MTKKSALAWATAAVLGLVGVLVARRELTRSDARPLLALPSASASSAATGAASSAESEPPPPAAGTGALCAKVHPRRAWRLREGSLLVPDKDEEVLAIDVDVDGVSGFGAHLYDENGVEFQHQYRFARLDSAGRPIDRLGDAFSGGKERVAIVAVCRTSDVKTLELELRAGQEACRTKVSVGEGPSWPRTPDYRVVAWSLAPKRAIVIVRAKDLLERETPALLVRALDDAGEARVGPRASAVVAVDADGAHVAPRAGAEPTFAIAFALPDEISASHPPNGYACTTREWCDLGPAGAKPSAEILEALDKAADAGR